MNEPYRPYGAARAGVQGTLAHEHAWLAIARRWLQTPDEAPPVVQRVLRCEQARARAAGRAYQPPSCARLAQLLEQQLRVARANAETKLTSSTGATI